MNIDTVRFSHILDTNYLYDLNHFSSHTAFVIAHKSESLETLLRVIWYLPQNSPILVVTNCREQEKEELEQGLASALTHRQCYLIHQKDPDIARIFARRGIHTLLGTDGKIVNGKGEGMYIGALFASLLSFPRWLVFYDADNFVPNALLEYTMAMSRIFMQGHGVPLQNVRICWSSKPTFGANPQSSSRILGRCTRVVSSLVNTLVTDWCGPQEQSIICSNAGEQGFTMEAIETLRFSSGYSVETFQMLDLLSRTLETDSRTAQPVVLQQYMAQSPHFHEKGDDEHVMQMIAASLGSFGYFKEFLSSRVERHLQEICEELRLDIPLPKLYPSIRDLGVEHHELNINNYRLFDRYPILLEQEAICG